MKNLLSFIPEFGGNGDEVTTKEVLRVLEFCLSDEWTLVAVAEGIRSDPELELEAPGHKVCNWIMSEDYGFMATMIFKVNKDTDFNEIKEVIEHMQEMGRYPKSEADESAANGCEYGESFSGDIYFDGSYARFRYFFDDSTR